MTQLDDVHGFKNYNSGGSKFIIELLIFKLIIKMVKEGEVKDDHSIQTEYAVIISSRN